MIPLGHSTQWETGYDKRGSNPNYGVKGMTIRFFYRGSKGAVQFVIGTGWVPWEPKPVKDLIGSVRYTKRADDFYPYGADLGFHSIKRPEYYSKNDQRDCNLLPRGKCYYDGSGLNAENMLVKLIYDGEPAMRETLKGYYDFQFDGGKWPL